MTSNRFDALDFARGLAILGMLGSHLVGTEGGTTMVERSITGLLATIEPTVGALFCVVAGMSWSIQAERAGVTPRFRRYFLARALALGGFGVAFHILFWKTEILVPFALMMALSLVVLGAGTRATALALVVVVAITPLSSRLVAPYAASDWVETGLHVADSTVGWVTLRYLLVDGNYPLIAWMAFPLVGMLFWRTARNRLTTAAWAVGSLGVAAMGWTVAALATPTGGAAEVRRWIADGWTPTSLIFVLTAGGGALAIVSALLARFGSAPLPRVFTPLVLLGRASLSHYVLHIGIAYSALRLAYPGEDWLPRTGLVALLAYLVISIPVTVFWFRHHSHGPLEALWARTSRRPGPRLMGDKRTGESPSIEIVRDNGFATLRARRSFAPRQVVFPLEGDHVTQPTRFTIQVGLGAHLDPVSDQKSPWRYLNHGCDPNVSIDIPRRAVVATRAIAAGEELRFDYNTTEWELAEPFVCNCGASTCVGVALGFAHLSPARQQLMLRVAAPHIRVLYAGRKLQPAEPGIRAGALGFEPGARV